VAVTMRDVAREAGVSIKTVSRVVNDQGEISEATRQRVLAVIKELGYRPSRLARALVTQKTQTVGLVVSDITNPFFPQTARGVLDAAMAQGYNVFLCNTGGDPQQELDILHSLADHGVDGIIIYPSYDSDDNLKSFVKHFHPLVVVNHPFEHPGVGQITVSNLRGAKLAVDYLASQGHSAIRMLTGIQDLSHDKVRRIQGFREAMATHGFTEIDDWIIPGKAPTFECGYEDTQRLLIQQPQVTAIFAYNDLLALGALQACRESGRRIPNDCAIIGFDDIIWAAKSIPPLTTIRVDKYALGQQTANRLFDMLENPEDTYSPIYVDVELVIRESA
jgi:LacI family transcriptional regulator